MSTLIHVRADGGAGFHSWLSTDSSMASVQVVNLHTLALHPQTTKLLRDTCRFIQGTKNPPIMSVKRYSQ